MALTRCARFKNRQKYLGHHRSQLVVHASFFASLGLNQIPIHRFPHTHHCCRLAARKSTARKSAASERLSHLTSMESEDDLWGATSTLSLRQCGLWVHPYRVRQSFIHLSKRKRDRIAPTDASKIRFHCIRVRESKAPSL